MCIVCPLSFLSVFSSCLCFLVSNLTFCFSLCLYLCLFLVVCCALFSNKNYFPARCVNFLSNLLPSFLLPPVLVKVKTHELREKDKAELLAQLEELKSDLSALRVAKVTGGAVSKLSKIKIVRKAIARTLTVYNQKAKTEARASVAGKKKISLNLRAKKTRALRRVLSKEDAGRKTPKQLKKEAYFPLRRYAVKA
jgi:large subunit ribosomal protein L35e